MWRIARVLPTVRPSRQMLRPSPPVEPEYISSLLRMAGALTAAALAMSLWFSMMELSLFKYDNGI